MLCRHAEGNYVTTHPGYQDMCLHKEVGPISHDICTSPENNIQRPIIGNVWTEATSGQNAEDLASTMLSTCTAAPTDTTQKFTFYMDNCCAQNKNWTLNNGSILVR